MTKPLDDKLGAGQNRMTATISISRFRKRYRQLSDGELALQDAIKDYAAKIEALIEISGVSRYNAIALTELETAVMYAVKQVTGEPTDKTDEEIMKLIRKAVRTTAD